MSLPMLRAWVIMKSSPAVCTPEGILKECRLPCRKPLSPLQPCNQLARTAPAANKPAGLQKRPASRFAAESRAVGASAQDKENAKLSLRLQELLDSPKPSATPVASMAELRQRFQAGTTRTTVLRTAPWTALWAPLLVDVSGNSDAKNFATSCSSCCAKILAQTPVQYESVLPQQVACQE